MMINIRHERQTGQFSKVGSDATGIGTTRRFARPARGAPATAASAAATATTATTAAATTTTGIGHG